MPTERAWGGILAPPLRPAVGARLLVGALLLLGPAAPRALVAQSAVAVLPVQGLSFGLLPGAAASVIDPLDSRRRAAVDVVGSGSITVTFVLPDALVGNTATPLPLSFAPTDGRIAVVGSGQVIVFDPNLPMSFSVPGGAKGASIYLGGTARPGPRQAPGAYSAAITVRVVVANAAT